MHVHSFPTSRVAATQPQNRQNPKISQPDGTKFPLWPRHAATDRHTSGAQRPLPTLGKAQATHGSMAVGLGSLSPAAFVAVIVAAVVCLVGGLTALAAYFFGGKSPAPTRGSSSPSPNVKAEVKPTLAKTKPTDVKIKPPEVKADSPPAEPSPAEKTSDVAPAEAKPGTDESTPEPSPEAGASTSPHTDFELYEPTPHMAQWPSPAAPATHRPHDVSYAPKVELRAPRPDTSRSLSQIDPSHGRVYELMHHANTAADPEPLALHVAARNEQSPLMIQRLWPQAGMVQSASAIQGTLCLMFVGRKIALALQARNLPATRLLRLGLTTITVACLVSSMWTRTQYSADMPSN